MPNCNNCTISVIGLGYVGLPLAVAFAKRQESFLNSEKLTRKVFGFDINSNRIEQLKKGFDKTNEMSKEDLIFQNNLFFTDNFEDLYDSDVFIITVPTPIDKFKKPDFNSLINASKMIGKIIKSRISDKFPIIIYESTVYPGATEEICIPLIELESNLIFNQDFFVGYSPERINPGDKKHTLESIIKVTSGSDHKTSTFINMLYSSIIKAGTHVVSSIKIAEAAKVIENTQRDLNIALVNELAFIFNQLNIPSNEVFEAASTKWNFLNFKPGLVGGHCIGVDPYYLTHKAKSIGYYPKVVLAGREINDEVSNWVVQKMVLNLARKKIIIGGTDILILGFSFKENCNDYRNTKVIDIVNDIKKYGMNPIIVDPLVDKESVFIEHDINIKKEIPKNKIFKAGIIAVAHNQFKSISVKDWQNIFDDNSIIIDIKNVLPYEIEAIRL